MLDRMNPDTIHAPAGNYSHTVKAGANAEWLVISGQVGIGKNGKLAFTKLLEEIIWQWVSKSLLNVPKYNGQFVAGKLCDRFIVINL